MAKTTNRRYTNMGLLEDVNTEVKDETVGQVIWRFFIAAAAGTSILYVGLLLSRIIN